MERRSFLAAIMGAIAAPALKPVYPAPIWKFGDYGAYDPCHWYPALHLRPGDDLRIMLSSGGEKVPSTDPVTVSVVFSGLIHPPSSV